MSAIVINIDTSLTNVPTIEIGKQGENGATQVVFDVSEMIETYGAGTAYVVVQRRGDAEPYLLDNTVQIGNTVTWTVSNIDTDVYGTGRVQLFWMINEQVAKTVTYQFYVEEALHDPQDAPVVPGGWISDEIGNLDNLTTTAKANLVAAINEVNSKAATNTTEIGTLANLTTTEKSNLVGAINEVNEDVSDVKEDLDEPDIWSPLPLTYTDGGYIKPNDGQVAAYSTWHYTDYIDVRTGNDSDSIYVTGSVNSVGSIEYNAFYTAAQVFISSFSCTAGEVSIPSNARYVRLSYPKASEFVQTLSIKKTTFRGEFEQAKENIRDDAIYIKSQLGFEAGGVATSTGQNYDGTEQRNRLRSKILKSNKPIKMYLPKALESPLTGIWFMVFYWDSDNTTGSRTSTSGWLRLPDAYSYTIPANVNFRILMYSEQSTTSVTNVKENIVYKAVELICPLPLQNSVEDMNTDVLSFVLSLPTTYPSQAKSAFSATSVPLTFIHFSDIHNKPALWKRIGEYADTYPTYLPFAIHTGDYVGDNQTSYTDLYNYYMPSVPFLNCAGNHDTYANSSHTTASKQSVYEKLFNHTSNWGVTFMSGDYSMTYYKDFPNSKIRLIVYDNYYDIDSQKTWIADKMTEAKSLGYSVVTASHQVTGKPADKIECSFQTLIPYDTAGIGSVLNTEFDAVIGAFINGGGKHIVHLCGHEHQDWFYKTSNGVLNCAIECATDDTLWTEGARVINTKTMDCFNAVGIDTDLGTIKVVRIGANSDCHNRAKNILSYDYVNGMVLANE